MAPKYRVSPLPEGRLSLDRRNRLDTTRISLRCFRGRTWRSTRYHCTWCKSLRALLKQFLGRSRYCNALSSLRCEYHASDQDVQDRYPKITRRSKAWLHRAYLQYHGTNSSQRRESSLFGFEAGYQPICEMYGTFG